MPNGQMDIRVSKRHDKFRLRFYAVSHDHLETIILALKIAREESNTMYDSVALENICLSYIESMNGKPRMMHV